MAQVRFAIRKHRQKIADMTRPTWLDRVAKAISRYFCEEVHAKAALLDSLADRTCKALEALPAEVHEECVRRHANGAYGWWIMQWTTPFLALDWAKSVQSEMATTTR